MDESSTSDTSDLNGTNTGTSGIQGNQVFDESQIEAISMDNEDDFDLSYAAGVQRRAAYKCWGGCCSVVVLFLVILVSTSFATVDYYEIGFAKRVSTGTVERDIVVEVGSYFWGPDYTVVTFPKNVIQMELEGVSVWTKASEESAGTTVTIDVSFQYKIVPELLPELYQKTGLNYAPLVRNLAIERIKNGAVEFAADEYLQKRRSVEARFRSLVDDALADSFMTVEGFQLREVFFPDTFKDNRLNAAIQIERNRAETYRLQTTVTRGETARLVTTLRNNKDFIIRDGQAQATLIEENARHLSTRLYENERTAAIHEFCEALGITGNEQKLSVDFMFNVLADSNSRVFMGVDDYQIHV